MKFTLQREQLLKPLQLVTGVVERRQTLPVLSNLLVQASEKGISLTGTDLEVEMVAHCAVDVQEDGEVTIPARKLADIWRSLPEGAEVSLSVEGERVTIRSGRSRFTLATLPASDFPKVEGGDADILVPLEPSALAGLIDQVSFAMAQQDVRVFLNGMLLEIVVTISAPLLQMVTGWLCPQSHARQKPLWIRASKRLFQGRRY
jgi:DNA polymerase-3 subunit beta